MAFRKVRPEDFRTEMAAGVQRLKLLATEAAQGGSPPLVAAGLVLERAMKLELSHPGTGRVYKRGGVLHQASAPGEPPAVDTGALRNSIGHEAVGDVLRVGSGLDYSAYLEFGTPKMEPRPFARPALADVQDQMTRAIVIELKPLTGEQSGSRFSSGQIPED
jgi:HK97 gp10 family phage protein